MAWHRLMPNVLGNTVRTVLSLGIGGGCLTLCVSYVGPFLRDHAELVAPFAVSNGLAAAFWYALLEKSLGLEALGGALSVPKLRGAPTVGELLGMVSRAPLPLGGVLVGLATAVSCPLLWPWALRWLWPAEVQEAFLGGAHAPHGGVDALREAYYSWLLLPVALPVSLVAGAGMHFALAPLLLGVPGVPWTARALPALAALSLAWAAWHALGRTQLRELFWERRLLPLDGLRPELGLAEASLNLCTLELRMDGGHAAERAASDRELLLLWQRARATWRYCSARLGALMAAAGSDGGGRAAGRAPWLRSAGAPPGEEEAEDARSLARLLAALGDRDGAALADDDDVAGGAHRSVASARAVRPRIAHISSALQPVDQLLDCCVLCVLGGGGGFGEERTGGLPGGSARALEQARARAADAGVESLDLLVLDLLAAASLSSAPAGAGSSLGGGGEQAGAPAAAEGALRLREHSVKACARGAPQQRGDAESSRRARTIVRSLFEREQLRTFAARLRGHGFRVEARHVARAERRLRSDERAERLWGVAARGAQLVWLALAAGALWQCAARWSSGRAQ